MSRLLFGNTVSRLMLNPPAWDHSIGLAAVAQRKLWLAKSGDAVVTAQPISSVFRDYVAQVTQTPAATVTVLSPACACTTPLPEAEGIESLLANYVEENSPELCAYALDEATLQLATTLDLSISGYGKMLPSFGQIKLFAEWNRKSVFRKIAAELGLAIAPGCYCANLTQVLHAVRKLQSSHWPLLIKLDRSSNGFGSLLLTDPAISESELESHFTKFKAQASGYVVEALMSFRQAPSIEARIDETGTQFAYLCDQLCNGQSFRGMVTPPSLSESSRGELFHAAEIFGGFLKTAGYRGYFDLDAGLTETGELIFTEANVRRTAGTALHELVTRVAGPQYQKDRIWLADTRPALRQAKLTDVITAIESEGMSYSLSARQGVLFPAFTLPQDSAWRYLIIGKDRMQLDEYENRLASLLGFTLSGPDHLSEREYPAKQSFIEPCL